MIVFGHRGAAGEAPENTIAAAQNGIQYGLRQVEIDLRLSADGQLVVIHDANLLRTTGLDRAVSQLHAADLEKLDARKMQPGWPSDDGCGVPTLEAYLQQTTAIQCYQLEIKSDENTDIESIINQLGRVFHSPESAEKIIATSFDNHLLEQLKTKIPYIKRGLVTMDRDALDNAVELKCDYFCPHESLCDERFIAQIRPHGLHVSAWTVNDNARIEQLMGLGVDSVISDYPEKSLTAIKNIIEKKNKRSRPERRQL